MKLRTEIHEGRVTVEFPVHTTELKDAIKHVHDILEHDSAYAHALVQAMDEFQPRIGWAMWDTAIPMITERAEEIMRGFGYTEDDHGK